MKQVIVVKLVLVNIVDNVSRFKSFLVPMVIGLIGQIQGSLMANVIVPAQEDECGSKWGSHTINLEAGHII